ncbi:LuxR C-terminal-related transcriptional regulator [Nocardia callitridis]|uniref:LuxR family transcriptional regulator n=1 Tax=Nocardia callitridis TaxID=648753 RepID=A0ABP9KQD3_9NOCA
MNADEWSEIRRCHEAGESIKGIAARMRMSRNTVRRALALNAAPDDHRSRVGKCADTVDAQVRELLIQDQGITIAEIGRRVHWSRSRTALARKVSEVRAELAHSNTTSSRIAAGVLPTPATKFVGRRTELRELRRLLGDNRLVSIIGPGGAGKTRLSIEAAHEFRRAFPDGVRFIEFAAVRTASLLAQVACDALALENREAHNRSPEQVLTEYLRDRRMLLILDNCEHVIDGAAALADRLLSATSTLRILTTTREHLAIPSEYAFHLPPLPTHDENGSGAVELFTARAAAVLSGFELTDRNVDAVERICEQLDGLPLAIELACARLTVLSLDDLSDLIVHRPAALTASARTGPPRHRSLPSAIGWSYDLCSPTERALWARLSIFPAGFTLSMAEKVCADIYPAKDTIMDTLAALVTKSVVVREKYEEHVRFRMLESIREYGHNHLSPSERGQLHTRLLAWCGETIAATARHWHGPDQIRHVDIIKHNRGNIRAAFGAAMSAPDDRCAVRTCVEALTSSMFLWACGISVREHRMWLTRALALPDIDASARGRVLLVLALVQTLQGDRESAEYSLYRARGIAEEIGATDLAATATHIGGLRDMFAGDLVAARASMTDAERRYDEHRAPADLVAMLRIHQGMLLSAADEIDSAGALFEQVYVETAALGERWFHSYAAYGLGLTALLRGDHTRARDLAIHGLRIQQSFGDVLGTTLMTDLLGWASAELGADGRAAVMLGAASSMWDSIGQQLYGSKRWIALRAKAVDTTRHRVGDAAFQKYWDEGRSMSTSDILDFIFDRHGETAVVPTAMASAGPYHRAGLTAREREVADYVVAGMTNRQIAERLVLSTRTVEGHVEHLLRKLGLQRRGELATTAPR